MSPLVYRIRTLLSQVLQDVHAQRAPGTNLALFTFLWMLISGRLLQSLGGSVRRCVNRKGGEPSLEEQSAEHQLGQEKRHRHARAYR